jgi:hypothetical protein
MRRISVIGLALAAVFAMSAVAVATASAAPEFLNKEKKAVVKKHFTGTSGKGELKAGSIVVTCTADKDTGEISGTKKVANVVVTFTGCSAEKEACKVKSPGAKEGEVKTNVLEGELGEVATSESATGVGLDLKPASGSFVTLEGSCILTTSVTGSVIAEVSPVKSLVTEGKLIYAEASGKQKIQKFVGGEKDTLSAFGFLEAREITSATEKFEEAVEVT